jgi:tRNA dimethylallyltransferase
VAPQDDRRSIHDLFTRPYSVEGIPHWGLDLVDPDEEFSVSQFKTYAKERIADMHRRGKLPIVVGGTGMWIWALVDNLTLTDTPPNPELRAKLEARSLDDLFSEYKQLDPDGAEVIDRDNKRRVVRALEVTLATGKPFSAQMKKGKPLYEALQIGIEVSRDELFRRADDRVVEMVAHGLIDEVRSLKTKYGCEVNAMSGIGYRQICFFLDNKANLPAAIEDTKRATRAYAKRQLTWFRRDDRIIWIANDLGTAADLVDTFCRRNSHRTKEP